MKLTHYRGVRMSVPARFISEIVRRISTKFAVGGLH